MFRFVYCFAIWLLTVFQVTAQSAKDSINCREIASLLLNDYTRAGCCFESFDLSIPHLLKEKQLRADFEESDFVKADLLNFKLQDILPERMKIISYSKLKMYEEDVSLLREDSAFVTISKPIFSKNKYKALVAFTYQCGRYCSYSKTYLLSKTDAGWKKVTYFHYTTW